MLKPKYLRKIPARFLTSGMSISVFQKGIFEKLSVPDSDDTDPLDPYLNCLLDPGPDLRIWTRKEYRIGGKKSNIFNILVTGTYSLPGTSAYLKSNFFSMDTKMPR